MKKCLDNQYLQKAHNLKQTRSLCLGSASAFAISLGLMAGLLLLQASVPAYVLARSTSLLGQHKELSAVIAHRRLDTRML